MQINLAETTATYCLGALRSVSSRESTALSQCKKYLAPAAQSYLTLY